MKHFLILLTAFFAAYSYTAAQSSEDSVKATINQMFEAMKNADPVALKDVFADSAVLQTVGRNKEGKTVIRTDAVSGFADQIGKLTKGSAIEKITFETIKIDGPLAIAWTPYKFYYNGAFSHCGVNSFQLVRINDKWKIVCLIDTRRRTACE